MTYQTVVRDVNNELVANQQIGLKISIFEDNANGPLVYSETHTANTNANGLVSVIVGMGIHAYPTSLADVQWGEHDHYLRVDIDPTGGVNYTITGTTQLLTVPYAFYAGSVRHADTALYLKNFSDTVKYAIHSDTANYAYNAGNANYATSAGNANYADSTRITNYANNAGNANYATSAGNANYADSTRITNYANNAGNANHSDTAFFAHYADTADYNKLLNRPSGTNMGDILYWDTLSATWHILPVGNIGEVLTLDSNHIPQWNAIPKQMNYDTATVTTYAVTSYTSTEATLNGNVSNSGNSPFIMSGFCWKKNSIPTVADPHSVDGLTTGNFSHYITGLDTGTTYHVRAYAINIAGTAYGQDRTFKTWGRPVVMTVGPAISITQNSAYCGGNVTSDGGTSLTARGVCWGTSNPPYLSSNNYSTGGYSTGTYTHYISNLAMGTTYYVRAYATNSIGTSYGSTVFSFKTLNKPTVSTDQIVTYDTNSAVVRGTVSDSGGVSVTERGLVWHTSSNPSISNNIGFTNNGTGIGTFNDTLTNLIPGQTYYVCAYARNSIGYNYGTIMSFTTNPVKPTVTTNAVVTNISGTQATSGGTISNNGGAIITTYGICWDTIANPVIGINNYNSVWWYSNSLPAPYSSIATGLIDNKTYWVRAYATNSAGTAYGTPVSFTTLELPKVTTDAITNISILSATSGGTVISEGSASVTSAGICYSQYPQPTISNTKTIDGSGLGHFTSNLSGLNDTTLYYVRAYATSSAGTSYGQQITFTTRSFACPGNATLTDIDNNVYNTVQIGTQCWMRENLKTEHYKDGNDITLGSSTATNYGYRYYPSGVSSNVSTYGYLYNWAAVTSGSGLCPSGWHIPTQTEWSTLVNYVSSQSQYYCNSNSTYIAKALAAKTLWNSSGSACRIGNDKTSNNKTGFSALPAGGYHGSYYNINAYGQFWSCTASNNNAYHLLLSIDYAYVSVNATEQFRGLSVRCIKD